MADVDWDVTGIGYGMRGSNISEIITRFEGQSHTPIHTFPWYLQQFN